MGASNGNGVAVQEPPVEDQSRPADDFPVDSFRDGARHLRRPFTAQAVKFKPQTVLGDDGKGVLCVAYIDARLVIERLNLVCPHLWADTYRPIGSGQMWCDLTVDGITRPDIGEGTGKALVSDALKRAAVKFGVGVSLYAVPSQTLWKSGGKLVDIWPSGKKPNGKAKYDARIEPAGEKELRARYAQWLAQVGVLKFGDALDHGDVEGSQGDLDEPADPAGQEDTGIDAGIAAQTISRQHAKRLVELAFAVGVESRLQLAASHVAGRDVGECSAKGKAAVALATLTVEQADRLEAWIGKKADEQSAAEASA